MFSRLFIMVFMLVLALGSADSYARGNKPCSGKKGGVSHCAGSKFVCNDGSISGSKKHCSAGSRDSGALGLVSGDGGMKASAKGEVCSCRSGKYCTGPRGGQYCTTDSGKKSYLKY